MRTTSLKIAVLATLVTLATAAPTVAVASTAMPPCTSPTICTVGT